MVEWAPLVFSIVGALFGLIATTLMGQTIGKLNGIERVMEKQGDQLLSHVTASHVHESGIVKLEEQIKNVLAVAKVAHERADKLQEKLEASRG